MDSLTLKRHNSFQNLIKGNWKYVFSPKPPIVRVQKSFWPQWNKRDLELGKTWPGDECFRLDLRTPVLLNENYLCKYLTFFYFLISVCDLRNIH